MEKIERDFKGVWIPKEIWLDHQMTWMEKLFLTEINSLNNEQGCYAKNSYFSKFFNLSANRSSEIINNLIKKKYLSAEYIYEGKEITKRILRIRKVEGGIRKVEAPPSGKAEVYNNTYINNTNNNNIIENSNEEESKDSPSLDKIDHYLIKEYNKLPNVQKHTMGTKIYKNCSILINGLLNSNFKNGIKTIFPNVKIDIEWFNKNNCKNLLMKKFTDEEIQTIFNNLNNYIDPNFYPHSSSGKISLLTYLFNERTGRSLALSHFLKPPCQGNQVVSIKHPEIEQTYIKTAFYDRKFSETEKRNFTLAINNFFDSVEKKLKILKENSYNVKYQGTVYQVHAAWVRDTLQKAKGFAPSSMISTENKFWDSFNNYLYDTYGSDLEPSLSALKNAKKKHDSEQKLRELNKCS